jgi:hypothetical protein
MKKIALMMVLLFSSTVFAATYYVATTGSDSANGSLSTPWKTISHAAGIVVAGDTVIVENGTYVETVNFQRGGTSGSPITFQAQNHWGAVIAPTSSQVSALSGSDVYINATYMILKNFEVVGPSDGTAIHAIKINGYNNDQVLGNKVHRIGTQTTCTQGGAVFSQGDNNTISGNYIYDVSPPRTAAQCYFMHGIYLGDEGVNGFVQNNIVFGVYQGFALQWDSYTTSPTSGWTVTNNTFFNDGSSAKAAGGGIYYSCPPGGCGNNKINNNIFSNMQNMSMEIGTYGTISSSDTFQNNLIYNSPAPSFTPSTPSTYTNTVTKDPLFVSYTGDQTGDYHLQSTSPAINAGTISGAPTTDFDGNARPQGALYDIGAYEFGLSTTPPSAPTSLTATVH